MTPRELWQRPPVRAAAARPRPRNWRKRSRITWNWPRPRICARACRRRRRAGSPPSASAASLRPRKAFGTSAGFRGLAHSCRRSLRPARHAQKPRLHPGECAHHRPGHRLVQPDVHRRQPDVPAPFARREGTGTARQPGSAGHVSGIRKVPGPELRLASRQAPLSGRFPSVLHWSHADGVNGAHGERIYGQLVSPEYFATLGVKPLLGRFFDPVLDPPGAEPSVVLSEHFWRSHFAADRRVTGRTLRLNGRQRRHCRRRSQAVLRRLSHPESVRYLRPHHGRRIGCAGIGR